jgi:hypothetical protein
LEQTYPALWKILKDLFGGPIIPENFESKVNLKNATTNQLYLYLGGPR